LTCSPKASAPASLSVSIDINTLTPAVALSSVNSTACSSLVSIHILNTTPLTIKPPILALLQLLAVTATAVQVPKAGHLIY